METDLLIDEGRASEKELGFAHGLLAQWCRDTMRGTPLVDKEGHAVLKPDGQPWLIPATPAAANVIRQFLKDNRIEAPVIPGVSDHGLDDLPTFDDTDNVVSIRK